MSNPTVYIETTIPSVYFETRRTPQLVAWRETTRRWWSAAASRYNLCTSMFVVDELRRAPAAKFRSAEVLLSPIRLLPGPAGLAEVIDYYIDQQVMPRDALGDAAHLAMCSLHGIDFLLTWNCRHLANANKFGHIAQINRRLGLSIPTITTPDQLVPERG